MPANTFNPFIIKALRTFTALALLTAAAGPIHAQTREQTANLFADVEIVKQESAHLRLQLQRVLKENENIRASMQQLLENQEGIRREYLDLVTGVEANIDALRISMKKAATMQRKEIIAAVSDQIEKFAKQIQPSKVSAVSAPAKKASSEIKYEFSDKFPQTGVEYTIQRGDNLWQIATDYHSKIQWIQNANRISDPGKLKVGSTIFLPQQ